MPTGQLGLFVTGNGSNRDRWLPIEPIDKLSGMDIKYKTSGVKITIHISSMNHTIWCRDRDLGNRNQVVELVHFHYKIRNEPVLTVF